MRETAYDIFLVVLAFCLIGAFGPLGMVLALLLLIYMIKRKRNK
jgi:hypothetical protein